MELSFIIVFDQFSIDECVVINDVYGLHVEENILLDESPFLGLELLELNVIDGIVVEENSITNDVLDIRFFLRIYF